MKKFHPLIQYKRSNIIEKLHLGCVCAINSDKKIILNFGNIKTQSFLFRSAQKPFQCYNLLKNNIYKKFGLTDKSLAIFSGSHTGTDAHIDLLKEILNKTGIKQENIKCPKSYPLDEKTKTKMLINNEAPTNLHNNCSGKHLAMLINCKENGWGFSDYLNPNHPLQQEIFSITKRFCEYRKETKFALDGCSAPVMGMPLLNLSTGFLNFSQDKNGQKIISACIKNHEIFGGKNRFDSEIIEITNGKIFAKVGAEGLCLAVNLKTNESLSVKILDDEMLSRALVVIECFKKLNWLTKTEQTKFETIYSSKIFTCNNEVTGEIELLI